MDRERYSEIGHRGFRHWNPLDTDAFEAAIAALEPGAHSRVLDIGCGRGEALLHIAQTYGATCVGIDIGERAMARARSETAARSVEPAPQWLHAPFVEKHFEPASFDLVLCIGSSHAVGGYADTLAAAHALLRPGGHFLIGEGHWMQELHPDYSAFLGGVPDDSGTHEANQDRARSAGFEVLRSHVSTLEDWDAYEGPYSANIEAFVAAHPDDPDAEAMLARCRPWRDMYLRHGRGTMGFALYTLRRR